MSDSSIKPEDDDEEAKRRMNDEMRGLMCGTSLNNPYNIDDTASEEDSPSNPEIPLLSRPEIASSNSEITSQPPPLPSVSTVTCKVCTTHHAPPTPMCCESCNNVLEPEKFEGKTWICNASDCHGIGVGYVNPADVGRCGICYAKAMDR